MTSDGSSGSGAASSSIEVTGIGVATAPSDAVRITLSATVVRPTLRAAADEGRALAAMLADRIEAAGVDRQGLSTLGVHAGPRHEHQRDRQVVVGYQWVTRLAVTLTALDLAGRVFDAVVDQGGDEVVVESVTTFTAEVTAVTERARAAAWDDALRAAGQLAELAGVELGPVLSLVENGSGGSEPGLRRAMAAASGPGVEPGSTEHRCILVVRFAVAEPNVGDGV